MKQEQDILFEELIAEYLSGSITDARKAALFDLIEGSETYRKRYDERVKLYAILHAPFFEAQKEERYQRLKARLNLRSETKVIRKWLIFARNAAAVILLMLMVSVGSILTYEKVSAPVAEFYNETTVPLGSQAKINLPDGSSVVLNSGTIFKYSSSYGKGKRAVYLQGEGYFEVAKNKEVPFLVYAGEMKVEVTGTKFNLRNYRENRLAEISLLEGGVNVSVEDRSIRLKPDEKAVYNQTSGLFYSEETDARKTAYWTTGRLSFVNTSFMDILKDIERKYNVKIHVESDKVRNEFFSGSIDVEKMSLQEVLNFIDVDKKYRFELHNGNIITLKNR